MYHVLYDNIKLNGIHISIEYIPFTLLSIVSHKSGLCSKSYGLINIVLCPENTLCTYAWIKRGNKHMYILREINIQIDR